MRKWFIVLFLLLTHVTMGQPPLYEHRGVQYATHGKDFWFCMPYAVHDINNDNNDHPCIYFMAEHNCTVTISNPLLGFSYTHHVISCHEINNRLDTLNLVELPSNVINFLDTLASGFANGMQPAALPQYRGFHITSTDTICVFLHPSSWTSRVSDVVNVLPTEMLRDEYVVQTYQNNRGMFQVVATEDSTVVDILLGDVDWIGRQKDSVVTVMLHRGMVYNVMVASKCGKYPDCCGGNQPPACNAMVSLGSHMFADSSSTSRFGYDSLAVDLSGTYIKARDNKRIAVFQGNQRVKVGSIPANIMYEQAMPIRYAGTEFLIPNLMFSNIDYIQFTGLVDGTEILIMNTADPSLPTRTLHVDARESNWFLMGATEGPLYIASTHPILTSTFPTMDTGKSPTLVVVPVEWWHNGPVNGSQVFYVDENNNGYSYYHCTHILTRTDDVGGMYYDRYPIDTMFQPIAGTPFSYAFIHYNSPFAAREAHRIENRRGGPFWVVSDCSREMFGRPLYSYPHLQRGKNYLEVNGVPADALPADSIWCMYDPIQFHGWVERPADSIIWDFGDGNVERYLYENGQWVTHTYADTGRFVVKRIIQYMDEALDTNWGYVACKSAFTRPSDTMYAHIWIRNHYDSAFAVTVCEGPFTFRGQVLETTDTHYVTTYWTASGCDTLWKIALTTCPHCSFRSDTISDEQLPWVFNGITFSHETRHYPIYIDIGEECDSVIDYYLIVIPHWGEPPMDTVFVLAPNVITPNGDIEVNRRFRLFCSKDIEVAEVYIFDRMGRRLAHFDGLTEEWDCTYDGKPVPQAGYVYYIRYIDGSNRNWKTKAGTFTIVR